MNIFKQKPIVIQQYLLWLYGCDLFSRPSVGHQMLVSTWITLIITLCKMCAALI